MRPDGRPLLVGDAEPGRVPQAPVGHEHVVAEDALERGADPGESAARALVERIGLELHAMAPERPERVRELEELRLVVDAAPLETRGDPGPADLEMPVDPVDRQEAGAADGRAARALDRGEGD